MIIMISLTCNITFLFFTCAFQSAIHSFLFPVFICFLVFLFEPPIFFETDRALMRCNSVSICHWMNSVTHKKNIKIRDFDCCVSWIGHIGNVINERLDCVMRMRNTCVLSDNKSNTQADRILHTHTLGKKFKRMKMKTQKWNRGKTVRSEKERKNKDRRKNNPREREREWKNKCKNTKLCYFSFLHLRFCLYKQNIYNQWIFWKCSFIGQATVIIQVSENCVASWLFYFMNITVPEMNKKSSITSHLHFYLHTFDCCQNETDHSSKYFFH